MSYNSICILEQFIPTNNMLGIKRIFLIVVFWVSMLCHGEIIQFSVAKQDCFIITNNTSVVEWKSINTTNSLKVVHRNASNWGLPTLDKYKISFQDATPLEFSSLMPIAYKKIFIVAQANDIKSWATLLDASKGLSIAPDIFFVTNGENFQFYNFTGGFQIYVNGENTNNAPINQSFIVELSLDEPLNLNNVFIGGSPAALEWDRSWNGDIYEILFVDEDLTEDQYSAIYTYLSIKHKIPVAIELNDNAYAILKALNVSSEPAFTTMILMR